MKIYFLASFIVCLLFLQCAPEESLSSQQSQIAAKTWDTNPMETLSGNLGYTFKGCSFSPTEKSCSKIAESDINVSIPNGAVVKKAYVFWSGSGRNDTNITLDGTKSCSSISTKTAGTNDFIFYKNYSDITSYVSSKGSGTYTVSNLDFDASGGYCGRWSSVGIASIIVVYEHPDLPVSDINLFLADLSSMQYPNQLIKENYHLPSAASGCSSCEEKEIEVCLNWGDGDNYKNEYCKLNGSVLAENTLNGSEAPNIDIDKYSGFAVPANKIIPIEFKGYMQGKPQVYEGAYLHCVVIKVLKGNNGSVCSCVTKPDGQPLANQIIKIKDEQGQITEVTTDADGKWCKNLPKGKYTITPQNGTQIVGETQFEVKACTCQTLPCITVKPMNCADADNDGVCDNVDACINEPGVPENDGCPQITFKSIADLPYATNYVSLKPSVSNPTLTNIIATPTASDQTSLNSYFILSILNFTPTVGADFQVKSVALKGISSYGTILSKTYNINVTAKVIYYNPSSKYIKLTYSGQFEEQGVSNTQTYNISGNVTTKYN
ncbi:hypothetical protein [Chryseobacterium sp. H1D6B]|uniref:hypothetical protein n=1 Tax=Chryseobacterium sp. H1D6B TaxID=2940588 RepID=UPI0015CE83AC|nr:hypothetical protein [Chryseobacterium sp. H1D6B]